MMPEHALLDPRPDPLFRDWAEPAGGSDSFTATPTHGGWGPEKLTIPADQATALYGHFAEDPDPRLVDAAVRAGSPALAAAKKAALYRPGRVAGEDGEEISPAFVTEAGDLAARAARELERDGAIRNPDRPVQMSPGERAALQELLEDTDRLASRGVHHVGRWGVTVFFDDVVAITGTEGQTMVSTAYNDARIDARTDTRGRVDGHSAEVGAEVSAPGELAKGGGKYATKEEWSQSTADARTRQMGKSQTKTKTVGTEDQMARVKIKITDGEATAYVKARNPVRITAKAPRS